LNGWLLSLQATRELSATGNATSLARINSPDVDVSPNLDPIVVARKPLCGTVAENVLQHGTGGLNVDGCRVAADWENDPSKRGFGYGVMKQGERARFAERANGEWGHKDSVQWTPTQGRWPANLIHDGSDEVVGLFPESDGGAFPKHTRGDSLINFRTAEQRAHRTEMGDTGSAARFFYCAKADASERRNSKHPTVKPLALMRYLCRLVCPPDGIVLDPFCGSGTTLEAARLEGFQAIGCELNPEYIADCKERLAQGVLF
jgi:site-specific DNA-methyltransferase (adenine-specific)